MITNKYTIACTCGKTYSGSALPGQVAVRCPNCGQAKHIWHTGTCHVPTTESNDHIIDPKYLG